MNRAGALGLILLAGCTTGRVASYIPPPARFNVPGGYYEVDTTSATRVNDVASAVFRMTLHDPATPKDGHTFDHAVMLQEHDCAKHVYRVRNATFFLRGVRVEGARAEDFTWRPVNSPAHAHICTLLLPEKR